MKKISAAVLTIALAAFLLGLAIPAWADDAAGDGGSTAAGAAADTDQGKEEPAADAGTDGTGTKAGDDATNKDVDGTNTKAADNETGTKAAGDTEGTDGTGTRAADDGAAKAAGDEETYTLTFYGNGHGPEVLYTVDVPAGTTVWDAIRATSGGILEWQNSTYIQVKEGEGVYYRVRFFSLDPEGEQGIDPEEDFQNTIEEDVALYAQWDSGITEVEITVEAPVCGSAVNTEMFPDMPFWDFSTQDVSPVVSLPSDALYTLTVDGYYDGFDKQNVPNALNGVILEGDQTYNVFVTINPKYGYFFPNEGITVTVNGATLATFESSSSWGQAFVTVTAVHEWGEWEETKAPTCAEPGEETRTCAGCGAEETREIPIDPDAHNWGEWTVTKEPTESATGEKERVCKNDSAHVEKETLPKLEPSKKPDIPATGDPLTAAMPALAVLAIVSAAGLVVARRLRKD